MAYAMACGVLLREPGKASTRRPARVESRGGFRHVVGNAHLNVFRAMGNAHHRDPDVDVCPKASTFIAVTLAAKAATVEW